MKDRILVDQHAYAYRRGLNRASDVIDNITVKTPEGVDDHAFQLGVLYASQYAVEEIGKIRDTSPEPLPGRAS